MDGSRILKWVVVLIVLIAAWKIVLPRLRGHSSDTKTVAGGSTTNSSCVAAAEHASESWGSGIGRFANPPYDVDAWTSFTHEVNSNIANTESLCTSSAESCVKVRSAMSDLRGLVGQLDSSIRGGAPPSSDIVQRQGAIDDQITAARELAQNGK